MINPLFLEAHAEASKEDNPNYNQAINGPFDDEYWKSAWTELGTLEGIEAQDVDYHDGDMNVIRLKLDFKIKRYPYELIKNFKDIFCARGNMKLGGMYFFKTDVPFFQWITISFMPILEILLQLKSNQGDITSAFLYAKLEENKKYLSIFQKDLSSMTNVEIEGY